MTDYKKLCEDLRSWFEYYISEECGEHLDCEHYCESDDCIVVRACDAIEKLQAENERLKKQLNEYHRFDGFLMAHGCFGGEDGKA